MLSVSRIGLYILEAHPSPNSPTAHSRGTKRQSIRDICDHRFSSPPHYSNSKGCRCLINVGREGLAMSALTRPFCRRRDVGWELARRATVRQPSWANARERLNRHQTGCGQNRSTGSLGGVMADTLGSRRRTGGLRSHFGGRERSAGDEDSSRPVFQPSNGEAHRSGSPVDSQRRNQTRAGQLVGKCTCCIRAILNHAMTNLPLSDCVAPRSFNAVPGDA